MVSPAPAGGPQWLQGSFPFKVKSILELMEAAGSRSIRPQSGAVTLHDPTIWSAAALQVSARSVATFVEMTPNRENNFCCGGGGGQLAMAKYKGRRLKAGGMKAEQIRASAAGIVVAPCHNCIDQLMELNKEYKLKVAVKSVAEMVAEALVRYPFFTPGDP
jgi:Fe-S oxidoreductase